MTDSAKVDKYNKRHQDDFPLHTNRKLLMYCNEFTGQKLRAASTVKFSAMCALELRFVKRVKLKTYSYF